MEKLDIPQGTLDLMILTILTREPPHGYGISQRRELRSGCLSQMSSTSFICAQQKVFDIALDVSVTQFWADRYCSRVKPRESLEPRHRARD